MSQSRALLRQAKPMSLETFTNTDSRRTGHQVQVSALDNLLEVTIIVIQQAITLLNETVTTDAQLSFASNSIPGSTIGKHIRHAHAHFLLLLECIEGGQPFILNYDSRKRQTPMESQVQCAKEELSGLVERFERLRGSTTISLEDPLTLNAVTPDRQVLQSSLGREVRGAISLMTRRYLQETF
jgi:hypothetical protein